MKKTAVLMLALIVALFGAQACKKKGTTSPTAVTDPGYTATITRTPTISPTRTYTGTATATITVTHTKTVTPTVTSTPTSTPTPRIRWYQAVVFRIITNEGSGPGTQVNCVLYQTVDGLSDTTCPITLIGPGSASTSLTYKSTTGGYALYSSANFTYTAGQTYVLESHTSAGTASATFVAPGDIVINTNGSGASWAFNRGHNVVVVGYSGGGVVQSFTTTASSFDIPLSTYPSSGAYRVDATSNDYPTTDGSVSIVGSSWIRDEYLRAVTVTLP